VPVLGEEDVVETGGEGVDEGDDLVAAGDGERAADTVDGGQKSFCRSMTRRASLVWSRVIGGIGWIPGGREN
jgi:hypothetical protein